MRRYAKAGVAALVLLIGLYWWYTRPVGIYELAPELEITKNCAHMDRFGADDFEHRDADVSLDTEEGKAILTQLEQLRLRRSIFNPLRQYLPSRVTGRAMEKGDYSYVIHLTGTGSYCHLQFFGDRWSYTTPKEKDYFPCHIPQGEETGNRIGNALWELGKA